MTTARRLMLLALVAVVQIAATTSSIALYERTLGSGEAMRFRLAPVDPVDPLRGYYVALRFAEETPTTATVDARLERGEHREVFVTLRVDEEGFARVARISPRRPSSGPYVRAMFYTWGDEPRLELPFDRFYTDKASASSIERAFFRRERVQAAFAVVRVLDGRGVIENLVVDGKDAVTGRPFPRDGHAAR